MTVSTRSTRTTCPYCGVGCGVLASHWNERLLAVSGDRRHPANNGRLCVKGSALPDTQHGGERLLHPAINGRRASWGAALDHVAGHFASVVADHGPNAVAMYLSGQLLTEDYYVANKFMKGFVGSANVDTNSRLCMASAVAAHKRAFGEDVVPCDYGDLEHCDLLVLVGSNAAWAHPVLYQRITERRSRGELKVVVVDPRRTATCDVADLHVALRPGSDAVLFNALLTHLDNVGAVDRGYVESHTNGFHDALAVARVDAASALETTGLPRSALQTFLRWFAASRRTVTLFSQGVNQASNGTDKANAIINCHLATGRIGAAGMGPFSITGQPNAMGGREVGGMASQLAAHADFDSEDVARLSRFWGSTSVARQPGRKAVDLFDAVGRGEIQAIWIMGTNPVVSMPRANLVREALEACPLVVVSDCVARTDTALCANVLLPAAGWGEKDGTVTNSERRISRQRGFLTPPGEARPDWWAVSQVAARMGFAGAFGYAEPTDIFAEHAELSGILNRGRRLFDISGLGGITRADYDALEPVQWPIRAGQPGSPPARVFAGGVFPTPDGRARFVPVCHREPVQQPDSAHPFILNSGRLRDQWHTMTRTGTTPRLFGHTDVPTVHVHPDDAAGCRITAGELAQIGNGRGIVRAIAITDDAIPPGTLFVPMHWNDQFAYPARVGVLVRGATDPLSGQPESKHAAVSLDRCRTTAWVRLACRNPLPAPWLADGIAFWCRIPARDAWRYEIAFERERAADALLDRLVACTAHGNVVEFDDACHGDRRLLVESATGKTMLAAFTGSSRSQLPPAAFVAGLLEDGPGIPPWLQLAGSGASGADYSRCVCTCFGVSENAIMSALASGAGDADELGRHLGCGTNCGSCVPELKAMIRARAVTGGCGSPTDRETSGG